MSSLPGRRRQHPLYTLLAPAKRALATFLNLKALTISSAIAVLSTMYFVLSNFDPPCLTKTPKSLPMIIMSKKGASEPLGVTEDMTKEVE